MGEDWTAYYSLNLPSHRYKQWCELDFVLVGPPGLLVLEVKGGGVSCHDGIWRFSDRFGHVHTRREGPFDQARSGAFALRERIEASLGKGWARCARFGWGVCFPDSSWEVLSAECPEEIVFDCRNSWTRSGLREFLAGLARFWTERCGSSRRDLAVEQLDQLNRYLRPEFDLVPSIARTAEIIQDRMLKLTDEQYAIVDSISGTERIICQGGAGTGKTFLALETARRELAEGRSPLIACASKHLVAFLSGQLTGKAGKVGVLTVQDLGSAPRTGGPWDVLIVDEGQDLLDPSSLDILDKCLSGGLDGGRWRWFMDLNNQSGLAGTSDPESEQYLRSLGAVEAVLRRNCRNTKQVVVNVQTSTGADVGIPSVEASGPPVVFRDVGDRADQAGKLAGQIERWLSEAVRPGDVAVLSPVSLEESCASLRAFAGAGGLAPLTIETASDPACGGAVFSTVAGFKGLERRFVAVVDLELACDPEEARRLLYVAMTRANTGLWIAVAPGFRPVLNSLQKESARKMLHAR